MFREGQYLEVIKASDNCLATAIVTVKERTVEIEKKKISTNKWLTLEDWSELYEIIKKAILRNSEAGRGVPDAKEKKRSLERRKSTRRLDIIYNFEAGNESSLPTIKVRVCRAKKRLKTETKSLNKQNNDSKNSSPTNNESPETQVKRLMEGTTSPSNLDEEYVPPELSSIKTKLDDNNLNYIPSRKSLLKQMRKTKNLNINNEYTPETSSTELKSPLSDCTTMYIPNPISSLKKKKRTHDIYEPPGLPSDLSDEYVPTLKNSSIKIDEYEPDFGATLVDPTISYIPSSKKIINNSDKNQEYVPLRKKIRKEHEPKKLTAKKKCLNNVKREI